MLVDCAGIAVGSRHSGAAGGQLSDQRRTLGPDEPREPPRCHAPWETNYVVVDSALTL